MAAPLENRLRVHREIVEGIKAECGSDFPVAIRMGMKFYIKGFTDRRFSAMKRQEGR